MRNRHPLHPSVQHHSTAGKHFSANRAFATARNESWLHWSKWLLPLILEKPNFFSRSFESMSRSWLLRSRSATEWFLAVICNKNTQRLPAILALGISSSQSWCWAESGCRLPTQRFPIQKWAFSGLCALPICELSAGVPVQWQLVVLMNMASARCPASLSNPQWLLFKY